MALLTPEEMVDVTGAKNPGKQIEVLEANRIGYIRRINGYPTTTWEAINSCLTQNGKLTSTRGADDGFNLQAIN